MCSRLATGPSSKEVRFVFCCMLPLRTYHHNRAVGVSNDRCGDASYQRPPNPSEPVAAHHDQAYAHTPRPGRLSPRPPLPVLM